MMLRISKIVLLLLVGLTPSPSKSAKYRCQVYLLVYLMEGRGVAFARTRVTVTTTGVTTTRN